MPDYSTMDPKARRELMSSLADGDADSAVAGCALWSADSDARKAAMREIRESEWFGLEQPTVKVSPHATNGFGF